MPETVTRNSASSVGRVRFGKQAAVIGAVALLAWTAPGLQAGQATDGLRFVEWQGRSPVALEGSIDGAISPSGNHLYVASLLDGAILTYRRDHRTGAVSIVQATTSAFLDGVAAVAMAPNGGDVYAAAIVSDSVVHLEREPNGGVLSSLVRAPDPPTGGPLDGASGVAVTADGAQVFAVGLDDSRVFIYERAPNGALAIPFAWDIGITGARDVAVSPDGLNVYVADLEGDRLFVIRRVLPGGVLVVQTLTQGIGGVTGLDGPYSVTVSPDGGEVYVAGFDGNTLAHFDRDPALGELTQVALFGNGAGGVAQLTSPLSVAVSDDGASVYAASHDPGGIYIFTRDPATGNLTFVEDRTETTDIYSGLDGAAAVLTHDDSVVAISLLSHTLSVWRRPAPDALRFVESQADEPPIVQVPEQVLTVPGVPLVFAFGPTGICTFCVEYTPFLRDVETGALTALGQGGLGGFPLTEASAVAIDPGGQHVYLVSDVEDALLMLTRLFGGSSLVPVEIHLDNASGVDGLDGVNSVVVSPDGAFVYTAARFDHALTRFARNPQNGSLTWLGTTPAPSARRIAQSRDGRHLYVTTSTSQLRAFARDPVTGALSQIDVESEGVGGVTGLANTVAVAVSPDGGSVLVTDNSTPALLSVFSRDPATGVLTWLETQDQGNMQQPLAVAVEATSRHVYVLGALDGTVAVYRRDPATGNLLYLRTEGSSTFDPLRLEGSQSLQLSSDGRHLYAAARTSEAVAVFSTDDIFLNGFEEGHLGAWSSFVPVPPPK